MIGFRHKGSFKNTELFLTKGSRLNLSNILNKYGKEGVQALSAATPRDSGKTASLWDYKIVISDSRYSIIWINNNIVSGVPIAIILQYGHATGTGGYVEGVDYINPALKPIFDRLADEAWKEIKQL